MAKGGKREGAGRKPGVKNKSSGEIRKLAQQHGPAALNKLVHLMKKGTTEQIQKDAAKEILERGYGKATQPVEGPGENGEFELVHTLRLVAATEDDKPSS